jgi:hypothetical protein
VVRHAISALRFIKRRPLLSLESEAINFWYHAEQQGLHLLVSEASYNILQRLTIYEEVQTFLSSVEVIFAGRYTTRWARRVRQVTAFTREDAYIVSLGTFGTDKTGAILGVTAIASQDLPLIQGYITHHQELTSRLRQMTAQLSPPFTTVTLPDIDTPQSWVRQWTLAS